MPNPIALRTKSIDPTNEDDERWWETQGAPSGGGHVGAASTRILVGFQQLDSEGAILPNVDGSDVASSATVRVTYYATSAQGFVVVGGAQEQQLELGEVVAVDAPPGYDFDVWTSAIANPADGAVGVRIWWDLYRP